MNKKAEALKRMKELNMYSGTINLFETDDTVCCTDGALGACYELDDEQKKRVSQFEKDHDGLVYHVICSHTTIGEMENYLYVSNYPEEWEMDNDNIKEGCQLCYVNNLTYPDCSEFGTIGIELTPAGGLTRTW